MAIAAVGSAVVVVAVATYSIFFTPRERRRRQERSQLRSARNVRIADAADGHVVRITGVIRLATNVQPIISPASGRHCVYYSVRVSRQEDGANPTVAHTESLKLTEGRAMDFLIEDESGVAEVITERASFDSEIDFSESTRGKATIKDAHLALLARHGISAPSESWVSRPVYVFSDAVFEVGERISVLARVQLAEADPDSVVTNPKADYRGGARPRRVLLIAPEGGNVIISDDKAVSKP